MITVMAIIAILYNIAWFTSREAIIITVVDKERITTGSGESMKGKFVVYTENEVFENTDSWLFLKFNSADFQSRLKPGERYAVIVAGWRIPFLSRYRNIINIK